MTPQPDDHTLNACLARVIEKVVKERMTESGIKFWVFYGEKGVTLWDPLYDANQMEEVEAWLVRTSHGWSIETFGSKYFAKVWNKHPQMGSANIWEQDAPDKKRAFALAIWEMEQASNGQ